MSPSQRAIAFRRMRGLKKIAVQPFHAVLVGPTHGNELSKALTVIKGHSPRIKVLLATDESHAVTSQRLKAHFTSPRRMPHHR